MKCDWTMKFHKPNITVENQKIGWSNWFRNASNGKSPMHLKLKISFLMFLSLLDSCIRSQILILGQIIHQHLLKRSLTLTSSTVLVKLTRLYASCNEVKLARHAFDEIIHPRTNLIPWDVMIRSYVSNDHPEKGLDLYDCYL